MKTLSKIAWRNIWRNPLRSLVVIFSIILGIWAGVFVSAFSFGLNKQRTESTIKNSLSHLQIHHPGWKQEPGVEKLLPHSRDVAEALDRESVVKAWAARTIANGMVASAHFTGGVRIMGVQPEREAALTGLSSKIDSGSYFDQERKNQVLIGRALAEKLEVKPGSRIVLTFTDTARNIVSGSFRVAGFFNLTSSQLEQSLVYVHRRDLQQLLSLGANSYHEYAALLKDDEKVAGFTNELSRRHPDLLVQSWRELSPELGFADELMTTMLYVIVGIIILALSFGIVNTMLMAVLERRKELGMLMGIGMSKSRVFGMVVLETLFLSISGGPLGLLFGYISISATQKNGLKLSAFSDGLESYGISATVYPELMSSFYWGTGLLVVLMTVLAALYPAQQALKLNPVEAIRTI